MRIERAEDAKSIVRKYIIGTRSRHGKITSILIEQEPTGPDNKGTWTIKGTYVTEERGKEQFSASVTSKGEVLMAIDKPADSSGKRPRTLRRR